MGEAFDKTAKLLDLGYPGGPAIERLALAGDPARFALPRPMKGRPGCDFSFAGLKTAIRQLVESLGPARTPRDTADIAAAFQAAAGDALADRTANAIALFKDRHPQPAKALVVAGGVAANRALRERLAVLAAANGLTLVAPPPRLCTDNAAMIAWAGIERLKLGLTDLVRFRAAPALAARSDRSTRARRRREGMKMHHSDSRDRLALSSHATGRG